MSRSGDERMNREPEMGVFPCWWAAAALALVLGTGCATVTAEREPVPAPPPPSARQVFLKSCSGCHEASSAYAYLGERDRWIRLVASMASKDIARVNAATMKTVIMYIDEHPAVVADVYRRRCQSCHPSLSTMKALDKNKAQWKTMVTFMGQRSGDRLTADEVEMLVNALGG